MGFFYEFSRKKGLFLLKMGNFWQKTGRRKIKNAPINRGHFKVF